MTQQVGKQSLAFVEAPFILESGSVAGTKEGQGPIGHEIDMVGDEDHFDADKWEQAESILQKKALTIALGKARVRESQVRYLFAGDLLGQTIATSFGLMDFKIPLFGVYGACSTAGETIGLAAMAVAAGYAELAAAVTSSHFASAEKQFRFPLEYANQRPLCSTWTVTGSGAFLICSRDFIQQQRALCAEKNMAARFNDTVRKTAKRSDIRLDAEWPNEILDDGCLEGKDGSACGKDKKKHSKKENMVAVTGITTGIIVDYGIKDSMNMGAAMAPAAADCIYNHLKDFDREPSDYDRIITGDLGVVGQEILIELLNQRGVDISAVHTDCGIEIFDNEEQGTGSGGSGCGCSAVTLSAHFLPMLRRGELKRVLFVPTGALLSKISFNEGQSVPGIAHAVVLEAVEV